MFSKEAIIKRFISYVVIDTQSDAKSNSCPSTKKQWDLANKLVKELKSIGLSDVTIDDNAYIMATIPATTSKKTPTIGFIAHFDTSPDFTGTNIKPQIIDKYDGKDIVLKNNVTLSPSYFSDLNQYIGQTLITTDGTTLLGADDKAGVTEIVSAAEYLIQHPEIEHGKIRIAFTPDEEIGRGAHLFDVSKFDAEYAYTMDGSQIGELEYENFNAAGAEVTINGKIVHPGYAKGKMINSMLIAQDFISSLPKSETPELTTDREGFFHLHEINGSVETTKLEYIIRDHNKDYFEDRKNIMKNLTKELNLKYGKDTIELEIKDQYFNMKEKIEPKMHIIEIAEQAMKNIGIKPLIKPIRGGTDGSQLSFMGLPCPNIFAGGHNFHGKYEYVPVESMIKASELIVKIAELTVKS